jgi:hypothetical protein
VPLPVVLVIINEGASIAEPQDLGALAADCASDAGIRPCSSRRVEKAQIRPALSYDPRHGANTSRAHQSKPSNAAASEL